LIPGCQKNPTKISLPLMIDFASKSGALRAESNQRLKL